MSTFEGPHPATLDRIVDGDTFYANLELPCDVTLRNWEVRLLAIDTFERFTAPGRDATKLATSLLTQPFQVRTHLVKGREKRDKYGRFLCDVILYDGRSLAEVLRDAGYEKR